MGMPLALINATSGRTRPYRRATDGEKGWRDDQKGLDMDDYHGRYVDFGLSGVMGG